MKTAVYGILGGFGVFLAVAAGMTKPILSWPIVALVVGTGLAVWGVTSFLKEVDFD